MHVSSGPVPAKLPMTNRIHLRDDATYADSKYEYDGVKLLEDGGMWPRKGSVRLLVK